MPSLTYPRKGHRPTADSLVERLALVEILAADAEGKVIGPAAVKLNEEQAQRRRRDFNEER